PVLWSSSGWCVAALVFLFFFSSRRRHTRFSRDWSSDVCSSDLQQYRPGIDRPAREQGATNRLHRKQWTIHRTASALRSAQKRNPAKADELLLSGEFEAPRFQTGVKT